MSPRENIVAIIQARVGSTRLPGKVLQEIGGKPILEHMIERVKRAKTLNRIVLATTTKREDARLFSIAGRQGVEFFRGSSADVLDRYYQAARKYGAETIVRLTGDCPLMDPSLIDRVVSFYKRNRWRYKYVSNVHPPTYPDGMDVEVFSFATLERVWKAARLLSEREHVTSYIYQHPELFAAKNVMGRENLSRFRLTVDTPEDLKLVRKIFAALYKKDGFCGLQTIVLFLKRNPQLVLINLHTRRNEGYTKSLRGDPTETVVLRTATLKDGRFLYDLRNEETVRQASLEDDSFSFNSHLKWLRKKLASKDSVLFIVEMGRIPIGQIRFDLRGDGEAEVGVAVRGEYRGRGYGLTIVKNASLCFFKAFPRVRKIHAFIRPKNKTSCKVFAKAGYRREGSVFVRGQKCVDMVLTSHAV